MPAYQFEQKADLSAIVGRNKIIASSIGPNGEACLLLIAPKYEKAPFGRDERKGGIFPLSKPRSCYPATFIRFDGEILQWSDLPELDIAFPAVQPLPNDEVLIVGSRCHYRDGDPEKNAVIHDKDGRVIRRFILGDGIADVQTTREGLIWVSYFDEGVFGNFGWSQPMGAAGLICFNRQGQIQWQFTPPAGADFISDCYALNVAPDAVWACYYTEFPLVKVQSGKVRAWKNRFGGARALAVAGRHVALWGGYGEEHSRCVLQDIGDDDLINGVQLDVRFPSRTKTRAMQVLGRGNALHALADDFWWVFRLDSTR